MPLQFNTAYYLEQNPDVAAALDSGAIPSAQWHFENFGAAEGRNPNANFDVSYYLAQNPDVAAAFENGVINPFDHFLRFGASENRAPTANLAPIAAGFDEEAYLAANEDVAAAVQSGVFADGYQHWVIYGRYEDSRPEATFNGGTPVSDVADTIDATELTAALDALNVANGNVTSYLEDARDNQFLQDNQSVTAESTTDAVDSAIGAELTASAGALETITGASGFEDRSATVQDALIQGALTDAQQSISTYQADIAKVSGLSSAITSYNNAQAKVESTAEAVDDAQVATAGAVASFEARANTFDAVSFTVSDDGGGSPGTVGSNGDFSNLTTVSSNGTDLLTLNSSGKLEVTTDGQNVAGITALRDAVQAQYDAQQASNSAVEASGNAETALNAVDIPANSDLLSATVTNGVEVAGELDTRQESLSDLNDAVARFENARDLDSGLDTVEQAQTDALNAIENTEANGGLGIQVLQGDDSFTSGSDVYLYNEDNAPTVDLAGFGDGGQDRIYFGDGYNFVQIPDGSTTSSNLGNVSELDIFWQQDGNDLNIFVENEAFAGNSSSASDLTEITLTGVTADEVNFANGYLSAGQMA